MILIDAPNLDDIVETDLEEARETYHKLFQYASHKLEARRARRTGDISIAQVYEAQCEELYNQLPIYTRW